MASAAVAQTPAQKLEELMKGYAAHGPFNGAVLVARHDSILLQQAYGEQDLATDKMLTNNSIFMIGSITKQFTSTVILQLEEEGKLKTSDKLSKYFTKAALKPGDSITIEQLLSHTAGLFNYTNDTAILGSGVNKPHTQSQIMALFSQKPLQFAPGTGWEYSNSGYFLLGMVIEKITGKSYEWNIRRRIFEPLGMSQSGFDFTRLASADKAVGYLGKLGKKGTPAPIMDSSITFAAGAIYSTTGDLYKWARAVMAGKLLSAASWKKAFTPVRNNYGYGWGIIAEPPGGVAHSGGVHGFNSSIYLVPEQQLAVIQLSNVNTGIEAEITKETLALLNDKPYQVPTERKSIALDSAQLKEYEGIYEMMPGIRFTVAQVSGNLMAQLTNQPAIEIYASEKDHFFYKVVKAEIQFKRNAAGKVDQLVLFQNGREIPCKKLP